MVMVCFLNLRHDEQRVEKGDPTTNDPGAISIGYQVENQVNHQILLDKMAGELETDANKPINVEIENINFSK